MDVLDLKLDIQASPTPAGSRVAAVVLAAGMSRRMGDRPKLLLDLGGKPMIRRTVKNVLAFAPAETVVVTGHRADEVEAAIADLPVRIVRNPRHDEGQPTSVVAGIRALQSACDAVMIVLGDQPLVTAADLRSLVDAFERLDQGSILVPHHNGKRGNPVIFPTRFIPDVLSGGVNVGCRRLIDTHPDSVARVEMESAAFVSDCDTPQDYERLRAALSGASA